MNIKLAFASAAALLALTVSGYADTPAQRVLYNVDAAAQCSQAAAGAAALAAGLDYCNVALRDPLMIHRGALLMNRGLIKARLSDTNGAMTDYNAALAVNPELGDAYVNRAALNLSLKRYDAARNDVTRGMQAGADNMAAAYFTRGAIADDQGNAQAAYADYKQALAIDPTYAAAKRELARFKVTRRTAAN